MEKNIGLIIKDIRINLHETQDVFAEKIGLTRSNLSQIERGVSMPTYIILKKIVNLFGIDANLMLKDKFEGSPSNSTDINVFYKEIEQLKKYIEILESQLKDKERIIELLSKK